MTRTRFSPSPTGLLHLGNLRAALFSALYAKGNDGDFILRIEDTDQSRSDMRFTEMLQDDLLWLGIKWQEGPGVEGQHAPYFQSQRHAIYDRYYQQLIQTNLAYPCFCSDHELALKRKLQLSRGQPPRYAGTCFNLSIEEIDKRIAEGKKPALRFHVPAQQNIEFVDLVKGPQSFKSDDIGDFIIRRAEGSASFMFCNAIDDALMGVTHVLRGEDHLANTPRQLMILAALKLHQPQYGHLSLITGEDGAPLSKRHGSFSLRDLREQGFLPQAVLNYLARLSHSYEDQRLMSFAELAANFRLDKLSRAAARFDTHQLLHWQKEAVMALNQEQTLAWLSDEFKQHVPQGSEDLFISTVKPNINFPQEAKAWANVLFNSQLEFDAEKLQILNEAGESFFNAIQVSMDKHGSDLKAIIDDLKQKLNLTEKKLFIPVRVALTGLLHGPELRQIGALLGKDNMQKRFDYALEQVRKFK